MCITVFVLSLLFTDCAAVYFLRIMYNHQIIWLYRRIASNARVHVYQLGPVGLVVCLCVHA